MDRERTPKGKQANSINAQFPRIRFPKGINQAVYPGHPAKPEHPSFLKRHCAFRQARPNPESRILRPGLAASGFPPDFRFFLCPPCCRADGAFSFFINGIFDVCLSINYDYNEPFGVCKREIELKDLMLYPGQFGSV